MRPRTCQAFDAVYPRWRGEHGRLVSYLVGLPGLSPLARGTLNFSSHTSNPPRFIPAGAGNTSMFPAWTPCRAVYPRWRGEHPNPSERVLRSFGLSPLARGTPRPPVRRDRRSRFIPAGAGNTASRERSRIVFPVYPRWRGEHALTPFCSCASAGLSPLARGTLYRAGK